MVASFIFFLKALEVEFEVVNRSLISMKAFFYFISAYSFGNRKCQCSNCMEIVQHSSLT